MTFAAFARAPLLWSAAVLAIYAPFAFIRPVLEEPLCDDWMDCQGRYIGVSFDPTPDPAHLWALLIIPGAFLAFAAALIEGASSRRAHWFMTPFVLTLFALSIYLFFEPFLFFISESGSYRPAIILASQHLALLGAIAASVPLGLIILAGAAILRLLRRRAPTS